MDVIRVYFGGLAVVFAIMALQDAIDWLVRKR